MAEGLEDIVQKVLLEGDIEVLKQLGELGEKGVEAFHELQEASHAGASGMTLFANAVATAVVALVAAGAAVAKFANEQAEAVQQTNLLAASFGTTTAKITAVEGAFAAAGVSVHVFEAFAQRLASTIAREWPAIAESVRTAATEQASAQEKVVASTLRVSDAQRNLGNVNAETASKITGANARVEQTFITLQFASQKAFAQIQHDIQSVQGASLGLEAAQQRLATLQGRPPSEAAKKALEIAQAQLAVDKQRQALTDAHTAQQQHRAEAALKAAQAEQAHADAQLKRDTLLQESATARVKAELAVKEAITAREQAEEKAAQTALKNIPAITDVVQNLIKGQKAADQAIDISKVKVEDFGKAIINAASVGGKQPEGIAVLAKMTELLSSEQGKLLNQSQRLAVVMQLGQQRMQQTGASASELLSVMSRGDAVFKKFEKLANDAFATSEPAKKNVEHFRDALTLLAYSIDLVNRSLAAAALPIFTHAMEALTKSLNEQDGVLHSFVGGIKAIGAAIGGIIHWFEEAFHWIDKTFNLAPGRAFQVVLGAILLLVSSFAAAWLAIPAAIAVVVTAVGYLYENWDKVKAAAQRAMDAMKDSTIYKFLDGLIEKIKQAWEWWKKLGTAKTETQAEPAKQDNSELISTVFPGLKLGAATGGLIKGPGTGTSDSIPARLSNGEFVMNAAAVATFGEGFMHAVNNMTFPGFAAGGLVSPGRRPGSGQSAMQPQSVLNLSIDGNTFEGLRGNKNVVDSLAAYAVGRQTSSAGKQPSWKG